MRLAASRIALFYFLLGCLWIVATDWLLVRLGNGYLELGQTAKGLMFVAFGAFLMYAITMRWLREKQESTEDRARLERRLAAVARFEAIGQLTGGIAHDFNNLITAIAGNIEAYASRLPEDADLPEELWEASRSAERAAELTRHLLAFGRRQVMRPERVDVNAVVEGMSALLHRLIGERIAIRTELDPDLEPVHADPGRLEQVVMNLAINARDAMAGEGELRIRTTNERVGRGQARRFPFPFRPGTYVRLDVEDTGIGMDADTQARIFEPFFTTKPKDVGTGLGLATVYGIVKQSGGHITVKSEPGQGTVFSVYLPRSASPHEAPLPPEPADAVEDDGAGTETVLVAEDDEAVRSLVRRVLQRRGFAVLEARDGTEALEVLRTGRFIDLLITDATMPELSGSQLIHAARAVTPGLRVLLVSGYTEEQLAGGVPYLSKPFTARQLVRRVRDVLDMEAPNGTGPYRGEAV